MRIRTIKPEFWSHPVMARLPDDFQLLALSLISMADDMGYFRAEPELVRGAVMPFREDLARISEGLARLSEEGWIEVYVNPKEGKIGKIKTWSNHQKVDHPTPSKLEPYATREFLANPREILAPDQGSRIKDQGSRKGGKFDPLSRELREGLSGSAEASPTSSEKPELSDEEWLGQLSQNEAYKDIDVRTQYARMTAWCGVNKKQPTRRRFINWLNRCEKPMAPPGATRPLTDADHEKGF